MRRNWLHSLLILLIALQSVMAMADLHSVEQTEVMNSNLSYQLNESNAFSEKNPTDKNIATTMIDCQDCNYCYCCYCTLSSIRLHASLGEAKKLIVDYGSSMIEISHSPFLRPPKT